MQTILDLLAVPLGALMRLCYSAVGRYTLAIIIFTFLTKVILFPISLWTHRNGIKMVELMPELNRLKIKYFGDKDTIAEETQLLYKERGYHPLLGTVPMIIQLILLLGVIGAVRTLLSGADSILTVLPSERGGAALLMPVGAGLAAMILGLAQNRLNPLQREQSKSGQWMTNGISIAISLFLGAFVPLGVGIYWICSNLFTIVQQLALNAVIPAKKYVDYEALEESRKELAEIEGLSTGISKEDKRREKADYKRFFSVANKHLVFYSEKSGFYKYFQNIIEYLLERSNVTIHYVTSDPKDQIFKIAEAQPRIRAYYIGETRLITLFMKMDADMVIMTMPDLENFHIKRSYVRKDVEYVYIFHGLFVGLRTVRPGALDHYDTLLTTDKNLEAEVRRWEEEHRLPKKKFIPCGYGVIDNMAKAYEAMRVNERHDGPPRALVAPSWQPGNIVESCLEPLCEALLEKGYDVTVRPHPQYSKRFPANYEKAVRATGRFPGDRFRWETDFSSNETVYCSDLLITDWSSIGYEYALSTEKPVLFINTEKKIVNPECEAWYRDEPGFDMKIRDIFGIALAPEEVREKGSDAIERLTRDREQFAADIDRVRREELYHFGESGKYGAKYLLEQLKKEKV